MMHTFSNVNHERTAGVQTCVGDLDGDNMIDVEAITRDSSQNIYPVYVSTQRMCQLTWIYLNYNYKKLQNYNININW